MVLSDAAIAWTIPALYLAAAGAVRLGHDDARRWAWAEIAAATACAAGLLAAGMAILDERQSDPLGLTMALLVTFLGWVIVRYSRRYLSGEPRQRRFVTALLATLASVGTVVLADHLVVLLLAWSATSLGLHHLLTFYPERPAATMAAHKKFIASRLAEVCLAVALVLIWSTAGTFSIEELGAFMSSSGSVPASMQAAALLIAIGAILKSAQLPVHGWLIQVMEAPTPVSALLHAGIVNLGGFVLIRLAPMVSAAPSAQVLLIVVGSLTAVLAALVMMTRVTVKVRLAWSTCAQMGFMLLECGLGLYELALLHLIAHSLYKAHAFLAAGGTVLEARQAALLAPATPGSGMRHAASGMAAVGLAFLVVSAWESWTASLAVPGAALFVLGLGIAPLLHPARAGGARSVLGAALVAIALVHAYLAAHVLFGSMPGVAAMAPSFAATAWVVLCFTTLYALQGWVITRPAGRLSRALYPHAYAGFHLDERFTRLTFKLWPMRTPVLRASLAGARA
jgi:NAD(P)H-quinone oxidoreductase subunit 5